MIEFEPPPFRTHSFIRGGHLQTLASIQSMPGVELPTVQHQVQLPDGDAVVLHDDVPPRWKPGDATLMLVHGLCGCHAAGYMIRLADHFFNHGIRVFRLDMRGCGSATHLAANLTHAGRSDDLIAALTKIASLTQAGPMGVIAVSLGGNQILRATGRIGAGEDATPDWYDRFQRLAVVSPPIDLATCAQNMQRWVLRPYNYYFIRVLLSRIPPQVARRPEFQSIMSGSRPKTLYQLDNLITAPLGGFADADDYYAQSAAAHVVATNRVPTLVLCAEDDPLIPITCFDQSWPAETTVHRSPGGGHVGFIGPSRRPWMDVVMDQWFDGFKRS